jgi:hypothetical protein
MATDKRARQRANRAEKQAHEAKRKRTSDTWRLIKKWALYGAIIVIVVLALSLLR